VAENQGSAGRSHRAYYGEGRLSALIRVKQGKRKHDLRKKGEGMMVRVWW